MKFIGFLATILDAAPFSATLLWFHKVRCELQGYFLLWDRQGFLLHGRILVNKTEVPLENGKNTCTKCLENANACTCACTIKTRVLCVCLTTALHTLSTPLLMLCFVWTMFHFRSLWLYPSTTKIENRGTNDSSIVLQHFSPTWQKKKGFAYYMG